MSLQDVVYRLDPALWCADVLGWQPDQWQAEVLRSADPRILLCCSRQSGKTQTVAALALHEAIYNPGALILMVSPSLRQSSEAFRRVAGFYQTICSAVPSAAESALRLELENGSRIVSLPGQEQTIRGFGGVKLLIIDEAARVEDELYLAVRPMLAVSDGRLIALSTPFGKRGWFFQAWSNPEGWRTWTVTADQCPRISREFLEEERRSMPKNWFEAEYYCKFTEVEDSVFGYDEVTRAISADVEPLEV